MRRAAGRRLAGAVLVAAGIAAVAQAAPAGGGLLPPLPGGPAADVVTTGNGSEVYETIPITRRAGRERRVAMTLSPDELPDLAEGDRLRITAELQTSNNCYKRNSLCISRPYRYSPRIGTRLVLARRARDTSGPGTLAITDRRVRRCRQTPGKREHHCMRVYRRGKLTLDDAGALPCRLDRCRVNLVIDANHRQARAGDVLILGVDREGGRVGQDRGRLNVTRLRGDVAFGKEMTTSRRRGKVPVERKVRTRKKESVFSLRLDGLQAGEQFTFDARATVGIGRLGYNAFVGSQLVFTTRPGVVHTTEFSRSVGSLHAEVTEANGFNCTQATTPCPVKKVGTLHVEQTPLRNGKPVAMYVNLVLRGSPKGKPGRRGDKMAVRPRGWIGAKRYPAG